MVVLVIGEALVDVVHAADGSVETHPGGSPFNVAIGLARLGVDVEIACQRGTDEAGRMLERVLAMEGVRESPVAPSERTSTAHARLADDGSATYDFDLTWQPDRLPDPSSYDAIHVGSLGTLVAPGADLVADLVVTADALGIPVTYDPNVRPTVAEAEAWRTAYDRLVPHARVFKSSDEDVDALFGGLDHLAVLEQVTSQGALAALTRGDAGALVAEGTRRVMVPPISIDVADTIGAGDSFMAAMLAWHAQYDWPLGGELDEDELLDLGTYAATAAALTCSRPGADPPTADELNAEL